MSAFLLAALLLTTLLGGCASQLSQLSQDSAGRLKASRPRSGPADHRAYVQYLNALDALQADELPGAERALRRALEYDPDSAGIRVLLARVLADKRDMAGAIAMTRQALEKAPGDYRATVQLAVLLQRDGKTDEAESWYRKAIALDPTREEAYIELANLFRVRGKPQDGLEVLARVKPEDDSLAIKLMLLQAALHKDLKQPEAAEEDYLAILDAYPDLIQAQRALKDLYLARGSLKAAAAHMEEVFAKHPWQVWMRDSLVELYARLADPEGVNRHLVEAADSDPDYAEELRLAAVEELAQRRQFDKALKVLEPILKQSSDNERAAFYAGYLYARRKDYAKAIDMFSRVPVSSEYYPKALEQRADALHAIGETDKAIQLLEGYLKGEPDDDDVRYTLVNILGRAKRPEQALVQVDDILKRNPDDVEAMSQKAFVLMDMGRTDDAVALLRSGLAPVRQRQRLYEALALVLGDGGRYQEAVEVLREALRVDPGSERLRFSLATYYDKLGQKEEAVAQVQKILEADENNAEALNFIGYTWAEQGIRLAEAEVLIKRALELDPDSGYITDSLGWVYFQSGRLPEALKLLERAVELTTQEPIIVEHLADALLKSGNKTRALEMLKRAASEINAEERPDPADQQRILKKYEDLKKALGAPEDRP